MKQIFTLLFLFFTSTQFTNAQAFQVLYPQNTSLSNPQIMNSYNDTVHGKIILSGWPYSGNIIINSFNISNSNFPCGTSMPPIASNTYYLNQLSISSSVCYSSGPIPDTIKYDIREGGGAILAEIFFLVDPNLSPANVTESAINTISFYPNPCSNFLQLELNNETSHLAEVLDLNGKVVLSFLVSKYNSKIDVYSLPSGFYILKLKDEKNKLRIAKFVKE